jgi:hypothetical protein
VAKAAIETDVADVVFMTEGRSLRDRRTDWWRLGDDAAPEQDTGKKNNQNNTRAELQHEDLLGSKNLRHEN